MNQLKFRIFPGVLMITVLACLPAARMLGQTPGGTVVYPTFNTSKCNSFTACTTNAKPCFVTSTSSSSCSSGLICNSLSCSSGNATLKACATTAGQTGSCDTYGFTSIDCICLFTAGTAGGSSDNCVSAAPASACNPPACGTGGTPVSKTYDVNNCL